VKDRHRAILLIEPAIFLALTFETCWLPLSPDCTNIFMNHFYMETTSAFQVALL